LCTVQISSIISIPDPTSGRLEEIILKASPIYFSFVQQCELSLLKIGKTSCPVGNTGVQLSSTRGWLPKLLPRSRELGPLCDHCGDRCRDADDIRCFLGSADSGEEDSTDYSRIQYRHLSLILPIGVQSHSSRFFAVVFRVPHSSVVHIGLVERDRLSRTHGRL